LSAEIYEVIIIGGGPAGLTAGMYAARAGLNSVLIEKGIFGGQITYAEHVENFSGFPEGISGQELGEKMREQAMKHGLKIITGEVTGLEIQGMLKTVKTTEGDFTGKAVIMAGGASKAKTGSGRGNQIDRQRSFLLRSLRQRVLPRLESGSSGWRRYSHHRGPAPGQVRL